MANYNKGKYKISIAGDDKIQNKSVAITDAEGKSVIGASINGVPLGDDTKFQDIVDGLAYGGIVSPSATITPDTSCYYICDGAGTFTAFGGVNVYNNDHVQILTHDGTAWRCTDLPWYTYTYMHGKVEDLMDIKDLIPSDADPDTNLLATENFVHDAKAFKGWFDSSSDLSTAYPTPVVGDFAYVHDASPATTVSIYRCATAGTWADSGFDVDTSLVQTFASSQSLNEVHIVNDCTTGGVNDVLTAEQGLVLNKQSQTTINTTDITSNILSSFISPKYPLFSNGNITTAGSTNTIGYYTIPYSILQNLKYVRAYLGCDGSNPAAIAFYSSDTTINNTTYIYGVRHKSTARTGSWFEGQVPRNARTCLVTNRSTNNANPIVLGITKTGLVLDIVNLQDRVFESEYSETLLGQINMVSGTTTASLVLDSNLYLNDIIKIVVPTTDNALSIGTVRYGLDLVRNVNGGTFYVRLEQETNKIWCYQSNAENIAISVYKCSSVPYEYYPKRIHNSIFRTEKGYTLSDWIVGYLFTVNGNTVSYNVQYATSGLIRRFNPHLKITLSDTTNYDFTIIYYNTYDVDSNTNWVNLGAMTSFDEDVKCNAFAITLHKKSTGAIQASDLSVISVVVSDTIAQYATQNDIEESIEKSFNQIGSINDAFSIKKPYYYHFQPNGFIKDGDGHDSIPSQTSYDIEVAARLGFDIVEANTHLTSDNKVLCMHGNGGNFGNTVYSLDNTDISNVAINTKTFEWVKENVRYNSYYDKYKVAPLSLVEFLQCCANHHLAVLIGPTPSNDIIETCKQYLNEDKIILYNAQASQRSVFNGTMDVWDNNSSTTPDAILFKASTFGLPFMYGLGPVLLASLVTNESLGTLCKDMHDKGFKLFSTAVYDTEANVQSAFEAGVDYSCSGHQVNPFEPNYEVYDLNDESSFGGTATIENGVATMSTGETIVCGNSNSIPLGKGMLSIRFSGAIIINFGSVGSSGRSLTSDGSKDVILSDYFFKRATTLTITATDDTEVQNLIYKTSKC